MRIALYEPDIPQNAGTILRLTACLGVEAHIIEPTGFPGFDRAFRRAGMDYLNRVKLVRHVSWTAFDAWRREQRLRLVLFTTAAERSYLEHEYRPGDVQRAHARLHRDFQPHVRGVVDGRRHAGRFAAEQQDVARPVLVFEV
jgi:hypothetical protein